MHLLSQCMGLSQGLEQWAVTEAAPAVSERQSIQSSNISIHDLQNSKAITACRRWSLFILNDV